jgi:replicative DNA helicase
MSVNKKLMASEELNKLALSVLSSLGEVHSLDCINSILSDIEGSPISSLNNVFTFVKDFYVTHGRFPDTELLKVKFPLQFYDPKTGYSPDVLIHITEELSKHRKLRDISEALSELDLDSITNIVTKDLRTSNGSGKVTVDSILEEYQKLKQVPKGLNLGIPEIDDFLLGLDYGTLNVIAAPTGCFKTTLAISTAYNACWNGKKVLYITLEVTPTKVMFDLLARHSYEIGSAIPASALKKARLGEADLLKKYPCATEENFLFVREDWMNNCPGHVEILGVSEILDYSPAYLEALVRKKKDEMGGLDMVYIDYLGLFKNKIPAKLKLDQYEALNYYVDFFMELCIKMNFILVMLAQINRDGTKKLDSQSDKGKEKRVATTAYFAEANSLERSASTAIVLHATPAMKNLGSLDAFVVKNRDGGSPETPIKTYVIPEYFLVGTKQVQERVGTAYGLSNTQDINDIVGQGDFDSFDNSEIDLGNIDLDSDE